MSKTAYPELVNSLSSFKDYGFTQLQAAAYIAILELGEDTGSAIAKASGINRSKIYDILGQLEEMGAVKQVSKEGRTRYVPIPPDKVLGGLLSKFTNHLEQSKNFLLTLMEKRAIVDPTSMTITKLKLKNIDLNQFNYLISSNERGRGQLFDQIAKKNLPGYQVKILNLYDNSHQGLIILINEELVYLFPTPTGNEIDAIKLEDKDMAFFITGLIESWWQRDLPDYIMGEIESGKLRGIHTGKSLYMRYKMVDGREFEYSRPISYLITATHISFFYEGQEEPKVPLFALNDVKINQDDSITLTFIRKDGAKLGEMTIKTVEKLLFMKNLLLTLAEALQ